MRELLSIPLLFVPRCHGDINSTFTLVVDGSGRRVGSRSRSSVVLLSW